MDHVTLRQLQLIQLEMLKDIDGVCRKHGLRYYLYGGTLLGAIRHHGFIPWDDDLDISMYREDYIKLQDILAGEYKEKYFIQNVYTDRKYPRVIAKARLRGTKLIEGSLQSVDCNDGIYVDIFPMDHVFKDEGLSMAIRGRLLRLCLAYKTMRAGSDNGRRRFLKKALRFTSFFIPAACVNRLIDYICSRDNGKNGRYTAIFLSGSGWRKQTHRNDVFGDGRYVEFEGVLFSAPCKAEDYLLKVYGDYLQPPPENKRYDRHNIVEIDFGPYADIKCPSGPLWKGTPYGNQGV